VLGAEVVALVQVLVYVGAVVVLVLFALMLTRAPTDVSTGIDAPVRQRVLALVVAAATTALLAGALLSVGPSTIEREGARGVARQVGEVLFAWWVLPFELLSVLLLAALVAALAISRRRREDV
jgi:NADH-quinone oxidoreductase subunit J